MEAADDFPESEIPFVETTLSDRADYWGVVSGNTTTELPQRFTFDELN